MTTAKRNSCEEVSIVSAVFVTHSASEDSGYLVTLFTLCQRKYSDELVQSQENTIIVDTFCLTLSDIGVVRVCGISQRANTDFGVHNDTTVDPNGARTRSPVTRRTDDHVLGASTYELFRWAR